MRRVALWCGVAVAAVAIALLSATAIMHRVWNHERAARTISAWVSKSILGGMHFGRVDYPWWPAVRSLVGGAPVRVDVWDFAITDPAGHDVITAPHVQTGLRLNRLVFAKLWGFLPGAKSNTQLHFVDAVIDQVRCELRPTRDDGVNLVAAFLKPANAPTSDGGGIVITVDRSTVVDGEFAMTFPAWSARLDHFSMQHQWLRYSSFPDENSPGHPAFTFRVERIVAPRGEVAMGAQQFLLENFVSPDFHSEADTLVVVADAHTTGALIKANGRLTTVFGAHRGVDLQLAVAHGRRALATLPSHDYLMGDANAHAHLHGPFSHVVIDGHADGLEFHGAGMTATDARTNFRLDHGELALTDIAANVFEGRVTGSTTIALAAKKIALDLELDHLELAKMGKLAPLEVLLIAAAGTARVIRLDKLAEDAHATVQWKGIRATVYVRPGATFPHRVTMEGTL